MGSDNFHHRRKAKKEKDLLRKQASRKSNPKVLIVCEGTKTEPNYFHGLRDSLRLSNLEIISDCGSDPHSIVKCAIEQDKNEAAKGDPYDRVFCIFDKDVSKLQPRNYARAIDSLSSRDRFFTTISNPCFEYWLLLHFCFTNKSYEGCSSVIRDLKIHIPQYEKNMGDIFLLLEDKIQEAIQRSRKALDESNKVGGDCCYTHVHELVLYLYSLKN